MNADGLSGYSLEAHVFLDILETARDTKFLFHSFRLNCVM